MNITDDTLIRDLPLSNRARNALCYSCGPDAWKGTWEYNPDRTFGEIKGLSDRELLRLPNFGTKSLKELTDLRNTALGVKALQRRMGLHSLLLAHESAVIALYDLQRADADADELLGLDVDGLAAKQQLTVARIREDILNKMQEGSEA